MVHTLGFTLPLGLAALLVITAQSHARTCGVATGLPGDERVIQQGSSIRSHSVSHGVPHLLTPHNRICSQKLTFSLLFCSYDTLKKYIYQLEKQQHEARLAAQARHDDPEAADEHTALFPSSDSSQPPDTDAVFRPLLDTELRKISSFYQSQERELLQELKELEELVESVDRDGVSGGVGMYEDGEEGDDDDDDDDDDEDEDDWNDSPVRERSTDRGVSAGATGTQRGNSKRRRGSSSLGRKSSELSFFSFYIRINLDTVGSVGRSYQGSSITSTTSR